MTTRSRFRPAVGIRYAVERDGIGILDTRSGTLHVLRYPGAAVWEMATRGYGFDRIVDCMQYVAGVTLSRSEEIVRQTFEGLSQHGLVALVACKEPADD